MEIEKIDHDDNDDFNNNNNNDNNIKKEIKIKNQKILLDDKLKY
jgi:hypothetical protein